MAVNAIMGSLLKHGYVDELAKLHPHLGGGRRRGPGRSPGAEADHGNRAGARLRQSQRSDPLPDLSGDSALQQKADEYGISLGKATLIQSLVDSSNHLTFESLVGLSINELNLLANSTAVQTPDSAGGQTSTTASNPALNSVGTASQSAISVWRPPRRPP